MLNGRAIILYESLIRYYRRYLSNVILDNLFAHVA